MENNQTNLIQNNNQYSPEAIFMANGAALSVKDIAITEIVSETPPFIVRWGASILLAICLLALCCLWLIKYPDVIKSKGILNSNNAPKEIVARSPGKLTKLFVSEGQFVQAGEVIGYMESTAHQEQVLKLDSVLDGFSRVMAEGRLGELPDLDKNYNSLGELQPDFEIFYTNFQQFKEYLKDGYYINRYKMLEEDISYLKALHEELIHQKTLTIDDLSLADSAFNMQKKLFDAKAISLMDFRIEVSKLIGKKMTLPTVSAMVTGNEMLQHEKRKEIAELGNQISQQKKLFNQSLNTLRSQVSNWKKNYIFFSPINGTIAFSSFFQENKEMKTGDIICFINPTNASFYAEAIIPQYNFGKIKPGQNVQVKVDAYPWQEFGFLKGQVEFISSIPTDSGYHAKIKLMNDLTTSHQKTIWYRTGLSIEADIITSDMKLIDRLLGNLKRQIAR